MRGIIVYNKFLNTDKFMQHVQMFMKAFENRGVKLTPVSNADITVSIRRGIEIKGERLPESFDFVLFWDKDTKLASCLELCGLRVFNSANCITLCDDKMLTMINLAVNGVSVPRSLLVPKTFNNIRFNNFDFMRGAEDELGYPMVIKRNIGSFGAGVYLAKNRDEAVKIISENSDCDLMLQKFIAESKGRDYRINVVGDEVVASVQRISYTDFRSNATLGGVMTPYEPTQKQKDLAISAVKATGADFAGVDILSDSLDDYVCEVNSNAHFVKLYEVTKINLAEKIANYITWTIEKENN